MGKLSLLGEFVDFLKENKKIGTQLKKEIVKEMKG